MWRRVASAMVMVFLAPASSMAQQPAQPPVDARLQGWLSETPVTLLDWGMLRLDREVRAAVAALDLAGGKDGPLKVGTMYRPFDRRVLAYLSLPMAGRARSMAQCQEIYVLLRDQLLAGAPGGISGAPWYLSRLFGSEARNTGGQRPEPFGEMLVNMVLLEVTLRVPEADAFGNGPPKITCAGRLDQEKATEVPPWRPPPS